MELGFDIAVPPALPAVGGLPAGASSAIFLGRGVRLPTDVAGVESCASREDPCAVWPLVDAAVGMDWRRGDGDAGDSGRRKGELRGEPYPRGEGLYPAGVAFAIALKLAWLLFPPTPAWERVLLVPTMMFTRGETKPSTLPGAAISRIELGRNALKACSVDFRCPHCAAMRRRW